jgi:putative endonuclease
MRQRNIQKHLINAVTYLKKHAGKWLKPSPSPHPAHLHLGKVSEQKAAKHLKNKGYRILTRNYNCMQGEIDLVAFQEGMVVFVEVRAKTDSAGPDPLETIDGGKRRRLIKAAHHYIQHHGLLRYPVNFRFDVIALRYSPDGTIREMEHIEDAFQSQFA